MRIKIKQEVESAKVVLDFLIFLEANMLIGVERVVVKEDIVQMKNALKKTLFRHAKQMKYALDSTTIGVMTSKGAREIMQAYSGCSHYVLGFVVQNIVVQANDWAEERINLMKMLLE